MREIKFKAFDKENKIMYLWKDIIEICKERILVTKPSGTVIRYYKPFDNIVLMQFTGLSDKDGKGKEIYHKDIFGSRRGNAIVEWIDDGWCVCWVDGALQGLMGFIAENPNYPIIGNIYSNPELLEK